jgi:hypothetical protein
MKHSPSTLALLFALGSGLLLSGCPRTPDAPEPLTGTPCEQLTDCNPGVSCGALRLCVDGYCEEGMSLMRPCRGAGESVLPPEP